MMMNRTPEPAAPAFIYHPAPTVVEEDLVNHPAHYTSHPAGIECIEIVERLNFCVGNAIKYPCGEPV